MAALTPTPRYNRVISSAAKIADDMGHDHLGVEHLFLAIIRERNSLPGQILGEEVDLAGLDQRIIEQMAATYTQ
ncbi:Clp protease N-terminal domain-containing protein [Nocardia araoensis]|uniref:Clp protease N-terminal domain-containing protein n=1 Tax=Nocardia araoensis TaxID=228600 RepID=UPI0012F629C3|nr:Clp protease N-terminal domain-containing protein [Nocardia araoensis]